MKAVTSLALLALFLTSCGQPPATVSGLGPGEACTADAQCQGGLECYAAQCDFTRCDDAPEPQVFCGQRLDAPASITRCDSGECVVERSDPGGACSVDEECTFGSACVGSVCTVTCRVDASCPDPSTRCLQRSSTSGDISFCQGVPTCDLAQSPVAFCAQSLGVEPEFAMCDSNTCRALLPPGEVDEPCSPDFGCLDGLFCLMGVCAEPGDLGDTCFQDSDCEVSSICVDDVCTRGCAGGCLEDEACFPRPGDSIGYCAAIDPMDCRTFPDPDGRCVELSGELATCGMDSGECFGTLSMSFVRLTFSGVAPELCEERMLAGLPAPGPAITAVELREEGNFPAISAYGFLSRFSMGPGENGYTSFLLADFVAPSPELFDSNGCPVLGPDEDLTQRVFAMGCGEDVYADILFADPAGGVIEWNPPEVYGDTLVVRLHDERSCPDYGTAVAVPDVRICRTVAYEDGEETTCGPPLRTTPMTGGLRATF